MFVYLCVIGRGSPRGRGEEKKRESCLMLDYTDDGNEAGDRNTGRFSSCCHDDSCNDAVRAELTVYLLMTPCCRWQTNLPEGSAMEADMQGARKPPGERAKQEQRIEPPTPPTLGVVALVPPSGVHSCHQHVCLRALGGAAEWMRSLSWSFSGSGSIFPASHSHY